MREVCQNISSKALKRQHKHRRLEFRELLLTYAFSPSPGAKPTGIFANTPINTLASAADAAVAVISSFCTSAVHALYASTSLCTLDVASAGSHGPPESAKIDALTEMMYAVAAHVVIPARSSVTKREFARG